MKVPLRARAETTTAAERCGPDGRFEGSFEASKKRQVRKRRGIRVKVRWKMKMNKRQRVRIRTEPRAQNSDSFILQVTAERDIYLQSAAARAPHPVLPASRRKSDVHAQKHLSPLPLQKKNLNCHT